MRRLLDPLILSLGVFGLQILVWWVFMPDTPNLQGSAGRYESGASYLRYAVFLGVWVNGLVIGKAFVTFCRKGRTSKEEPNQEGLDLVFFEHVAWIAAALAFIGELIYLRQILQNPHLLVEAFQSGLFMSVGEQTSSERVVGISSLNNLFVIPTAVYALMAFGSQGIELQRAKARRWLVLLGLLVLIHAMLFVGRQLFVVFIFIVLGAYLLNQVRGRRSLIPAVVPAILLVVIVIWLGETFRGGKFYASNHDTGLFSGQTQAYVASRLAEGYFASDVNNAFRLLDCKPPMEWIATTMWSTPATRLGLEETPFKKCHLWTSLTYNTANVFSLWWWDAGWFGILYDFAVAVWLGATYRLATDKSNRSALIQILYVLSYAHIVGLMRINAFSTTVFVVPTFFLIVAWLVRPERYEFSSARIGRCRS